ncbi:MAG: MFS transporter [Erysipelotrichaceae bacterium]|nr:MFS transporter [Erysipelotrichaceae bacterium]
MKQTKIDHLSAGIFDSRIKEKKISRKEELLGYFIGPVSVLLMNSILNNYLNVYYTDVVRLGSLWGGWFLTGFPIAVKLIDAFTYIIMGAVLSRFYSRQGIARPWIFFSAPLLCVSMILLFVVPEGNGALTAFWIFFSYNLFYSVAYTAYNTAHTLMVPLSTSDPEERGKLSVFTNMQGMLSGMLVAVLFPTIVLPRIGVQRSSWVLLMCVIAVIALPLILLEYYYTRERVTEESRAQGKEAEAEKSSLGLKEQLHYCLKSRSWIVLMIFLLLSNFCTLISHFSTFYYCNWVLGSYNDGITQMLYYAIGNGVLGPALLIVRPLCRKLGRRNAMAGGFLLSFFGTLLCYLNYTDLKLVLIGQVIKSIGLIPSTFMISAMLADALDDVQNTTGKRCEGLSSAAFNVIMTITTGLAMALLNYGITHLGYIAPTPGNIPVQSETIRQFFAFCAVGVQTVVYPFIAVILLLSPDERKLYNNHRS